MSSTNLHTRNTHVLYMTRYSVAGRLRVNRSSSTERTWSWGCVGTRSAGRRSRAACAPPVLPAATSRSPAHASLASGRSHMALHEDERAQYMSQESSGVLRYAFPCARPNRSCRL